ncbi:MAG: hypothetical protein ACHQFW_09245, partial [Chitinophagales bacterium]
IVVIKYIFPILFCIASRNISAQQEFERRMIIEHDTFYVIEVNNETQLATLLVGNINDTIENGFRYTVPAGTKRRNNNPIPFSWTIHNDTLFCISFIDFAQMSPVNSFRTIPLASLSLFDSTEKPIKYLMLSTREFNSIKNIPLIQTYKNYTYVDDLYFDICFLGDTLYQCTSVNNEMTIWKCNNLEWIAEQTIPFQATGFFSCISDSNLHIISTSGSWYIFPAGISIPEGLNTYSPQKIIIEDRDTGAFYYVDAAIFKNKKKTMSEILRLNSKK